MKNNIMKQGFLTGLLVFAVCSANFAQTKGKYTNLFDEAKIKSNTKYLSDDKFEGRAPGSKSGEAAAQYIADELKRIGVKPANNGSYFQPVSLVAVKTNPQTVLDVGGQQYKFGDDFVGSTGAQIANVKLAADLVFVGYGIDAPEQKWNDFKGNATAYKGKILVMMVNDPPATTEEPNFFGGKGLTYYGRWTYKFEQAARMGAAGVILIHTTDSAGYGWNVVRTSNGSWRFDVARTPEDKTPFLNFRSWMTEDTARKIFTQAGKNLDEMREKAKSRDFQPVNLDLKAKLDVQSETKKLDSNNVIGVWEGGDKKLKNEYVVYSAHWDHLGIGEPDKNGDKIYNGALDNASGCASILAIAEVIAKLPKAEQPKRSQVYFFPTAEEQGLLGAEWYAKNPVFPLAKTAANINHDGANFYGLTTDYGALGAERSSLEPIVNAVLQERAMTFAVDERPEQGSFYRSDHFPFAKVGVPSLSIRSGTNYVGQDKNAAQKRFEEFNALHYHQPSDNFNENWRYDGLVQNLEVSLAIGLKVSNAAKMPAYKQSDEFAKAQPNRK
ncbi:MAG: M28 family peptidase [Pyrinomonadaceae bacterium]|nr:M28 family peptidase [Pyrinomonadaceae bacterium]